MALDTQHAVCVSAIIIQVFSKLKLRFKSLYVFPCSAAADGMVLHIIRIFMFWHVNTSGYILLQISDFYNLITVKKKKTA